jgi:hypothetical protein
VQVARKTEQGADLYPQSSGSRVGKLRGKSSIFRVKKGVFWVTRN